jgi:ankyrin repeat protein
VATRVDSLEVQLNRIDSSYDNVWDFIFRGQVPEKAQQELRCITVDKARDWVEEQNFPLVHQIVFGLSNKSLETELTENVLAKYLKDAAGRTALDWAVARDQVDSVAILLEHGANPNTLDVSGRTAMLHAVDCNSARCMRLLLEAGAHPDPVLPKGLYRSSPLTAAAMGGKKELMQILLEFEANANCTNPEGLTPLHSIARSRDATCALILLEHGADLNALSNDGRTPLTTAIIYNNHEVLELFLDRCYEYIITACLRGTCHLCSSVSICLANTVDHRSAASTFCRRVCRSQNHDDTCLIFDVKTQL